MAQTRQVITATLEDMQVLSNPQTNISDMLEVYNQIVARITAQPAPHRAALSTLGDAAQGIVHNLMRNERLLEQARNAKDLLELRNALFQWRALIVVTDDELRSYESLRFALDIWCADAAPLDSLHQESRAIIVRQHWAPFDNMSATREVIAENYGVSAASLYELSGSVDSAVPKCNRQRLSELITQRIVLKQHLAACRLRTPSRVCDMASRLYYWHIVGHDSRVFNLSTVERAEEAAGLLKRIGSTK